MKSDEASRTALLIARQRAVHQVLDLGSILNDPFVLRLLQEDQTELLRFAAAHPLASIGRLFTAARSRIAEDAAASAVDRGVRQVVILGAGLDTFAFRHPRSAQPIRIYEVDHPATQTWKRQCLVRAQLAPPPSLVFVPADFEHDDLAEMLANAGFERNVSAFFTWLGVAPYLTPDAIGTTLDFIASIPNAEVVFDYMEPPHAFSPDLNEAVAKRNEQLENVGERSSSCFEPAGIETLLRSRGFCGVEDTSFRAIRSRFGRSVQGLTPGQAGLHVVHAIRR